MKLQSCGNPDCPICRWRDEEHPDSGHPEDSLAELLIGAAAIVMLFIVALIILPILAS